MLSLENKYRFAFLAGVLLLFMSLFLDWFHLEAYKDGKQIANWSYNIFTEWSSTKKASGFNKEARPNNLQVPMAMNILFVITIFLAIYSVLFRTIDEKKDLSQKSMGFAYLNFFLLFLNGFYVFIFPFFYLIPNNLFFPFIIVKDTETKIVYHYFIGTGWVFQVIAFILIFPYTLFYYDVARKFELKEYTPKKIIKKYTAHIRENIDFDGLIAEEKIESEIGKGLTKETLYTFDKSRKKGRVKN